VYARCTPTIENQTRHHIIYIFSANFIFLFIFHNRSISISVSVYPLLHYSNLNSLHLHRCAVQYCAVHQSVINSFFSSVPTYHPVSPHTSGPSLHPPDCLLPSHINSLPPDVVPLLSASPT